MSSGPTDRRMDALDANSIFGVAGRVIGCEGEVHEVVGSAMDVARRRTVAGAPDGYVVLAEKQRAGRGRMGPWECPARQGLLMGVILRLGLRASERRLVGLMGVVAATEAVQHFGVQARIKWPNDVVIAERAEGLKLRKLGGVLVEQARRGDSAPAHLLGIGLNVNQDRRGLPAVAALPPTSMKIELGGRMLDRNELCEVLLGRLDHWYGKLRLGHGEALLARWRALSCLLGETVRAEVQGQIVDGKVVGLRATGELILRSADGAEQFLSSERATLLFG